jgi:hypothetical protein
LRAQLSNFGGDLGSLGGRFSTGFGHDRHDLRAGLQRSPDSHGLLNALNLFVCPPVNLVEVLAKAIQKPTDLFGDARHGKKLVCRVDVLTGSVGAPAAEPVD